MKHLLLFIFTTSLSHLLFAKPPEPNVGERWVLNTQYSDEFNGTSLDNEKWRTTFGGWKGRQPAFFNPNVPIVNDGNMIIRNQFGVPANAPGGYTISGGAVQSIKEEAHYGYYECNFRSSRINMSTTFWLASSGRQETRTADTNDTYSQELDICESIGGTGNFSSDFRKKMKFNTHYRLRKDPFPTPETFYSKGNNQVEIRDGELVGGDASLKTSESWEDYHTYACHWRSAQEAAFYVDNRFIGVITFRTDVVSDPFKDPMRMNLVTETYNWARPLPTEQELNNDAINASYYNWVRSYVSLGIDENDANGTPVSSGIPGEVVFIDFENGNFNGWSKFGPVPDTPSNTDTFDGSKFALKVNGANGGREYVVNVNPNTDYTLKAQIKASSGGIAFGIKQLGAGAATLASETVTDTNYKETILTFNSGSDTKLKFFLFASLATDIGFGDNFELVETNPGSNPTPEIVNNTYQFPEELSFFETAKLIDNNSKVEISYLYKTNQKNTFRIKILDKDNTEVDEVSFDVLAGYGKNIKTITLTNALPVGEYTIKGEIVKTTDTGSIVLSDSEGFTTAPPAEAPPTIASDNFKVLSTGLSCPEC